MILGLLVVMVSMLGGFAVASGAPSSITTCTKASNGKMKIITSGGVAKCTAKGKGTANTWDNHSVVGPQLAAMSATIAAQNAQIAQIKADFCAFDTDANTDFNITFAISNNGTALVHYVTLHNALGGCL